MKDQFPRTSLSRQDTAYCFVEDILTINVPSFVCSTFSHLSFRNFFHQKQGKKKSTLKCCFRENNMTGTKTIKNLLKKKFRKRKKKWILFFCSNVFIIVHIGPKKLLENIINKRLNSYSFCKDISSQILKKHARFN